MAQKRTRYIYIRYHFIHDYTEDDTDTIKLLDLLAVTRNTCSRIYSPRYYLNHNTNVCETKSSPM